MKQLNRLTPAARRRLLLARISHQRGRVELHHGSWRVEYWLRDINAPKGWRRVRERLNATTQKEALREAAPLIASANERNQAIRVSTRTPTVKEFAEAGWKKYLERRELKPSTLGPYKSMLDNYVLPTEGEKRLHRITPTDITRILESAAEEGKAPKYVVNLYQFLHVFFEVAQQSDLIATSPARPKIHRPIAHRTEKPSLSAGDAWKVLANIEPNFRLIFVTDALTGYRAGELLGFRWLNFNAEAGTLQATHGLYNGRLVEGVKTARSSKPLKLARVLTLMLQEHRASSEWNQAEHFIFSRSDAKPFDPSFLREKVLYPALRKAEIEPGDRTHGFHLFRHSAASILAELTHDPMLVRDLLRHTRLSTTAGYVHTEVAAEGASEALADAIIGKGERVN